ncbi:mannosyltransferase putative-domain-containing protein [Truncatella angustata]|uniref:Mannosyltransferase putative-domain-containing protein n=1 Tax=Truncatella angustata TaxID=152316 RepID=A0A9P9A231_9PEZI|nr:mannosyltransferase putative-domain-containing protein [Truncatella angustata]KAH6658714.1 mannosyltransferase putative-domain-containing protein [Truncatella angustata]KAH8203474.1 hypothetical protein TruAng_002345 [Truncatella angustata]
MRLALRWLAFLIPAIVLLVYLRRTDRLPSSLSAASTPVVAIQDEEGSISHKTISLFWQRWSQLMYENRPEGNKIKISGNAGTVPPKDANGFRQPYNDLVKNTATEIEEMRRSHQRFLKELDASLDAIDHGIFKGRGVVMVGGGEYFGPAIIGIQMLRRTGSTLPVEVFVPNDSEYEKEICEEYLPKLNAKCVVLSHFQPDNSQRAGDVVIKHYQLKAPTLLLSSFAEVLLLDSDSIPLVDPDTTIFEAEPYRSNGLITWPDFWAATESPKFWDIAGLSGFPEDLPPTSSESGQLVINKKQHLSTLLLATYYNLFGLDFYYPLLSQGALGQGDKETFMAAAVALGTPYYRVKAPAVALGRHDGGKQKGTAIVQHLPLDDYASRQGGSDKIRPAFLHANTPKMNAGHLVDEGDLVSVDGKSRLRLLGPKDEAERLFGYDVEDTLWDLLVQTGCELASSLHEWKQRARLCERLTEHHKLVFENR